MTQGTFVVKPDVLTNTLTIRLSGDGVSVPAEEVIWYLESDGLVARTRNRVCSVDNTRLEGVVVFRVVFTEPFRGFEQLDLQDAMERFYAERSLSCV